MTFISNIVQKEMIKYNHIPSLVTFTLTIQSHRKWLVGRRYAWVSGARPHEHKRTSTHFRTTKHNIIHINGPDKSYLHCLRSFLLLRFLYLCILSFDVLSLELKPWEQYADAEALLDLANILVSSVKSHSACSISTAEFVNALIHGFGETCLGLDDADEITLVLMKWKDCRNWISHCR